MCRARPVASDPRRHYAHQVLTPSTVRTIMSNPPTSEATGPDLAGWTRRGATIEALVNTGSGHTALLDIRSLHADIQRFLASPIDAPEALVRHASDVASLLERLAAGLATDQVQSITGLGRQLRRLQETRPAPHLPGERWCRTE
jgi:hypothetical protein